MKIEYTNGTEMATIVADSVKVVVREMFGEADEIHVTITSEGSLWTLSEKVLWSLRDVRGLTFSLRQLALSARN